MKNQIKMNKNDNEYMTGNFKIIRFGEKLKLVN